jgi:hypothetical protein
MQELRNVNETKMEESWWDIRGTRGYQAIRTLYILIATCHNYNMEEQIYEIGREGSCCWPTTPKLGEHQRRIVRV